MKKSIIILGVALVTFTNVISAVAQQSSFKEDCLTQAAPSNTGLDGSQSSESRKTNGDVASIDLETINATTHQRTMEEIIAENNQIIESTVSPEQYVKESLSEEIEISIEVSPVNSQKEIEDRIQQDIQIIDGTVLNAVLPVTLKKSKKS